MKILIIGGTRNMGHFLTLALREANHEVTILNRGITRDDLPDDIERLRADRSVATQLEAALRGRTFDAVVDFVLYNGDEAQVAVDLLHGKTDHYIFISTGQVYLVRQGIQRPFREADYDGDLIPEPPLNTYDHEEWAYGHQKRRTEDALSHAFAQRGFPFTSLRLPMVNSERDPFNRLYSYILRIKDNGPILVPDAPDHELRHVYAGDVVRAIMLLIDGEIGKGRVFNLSQAETLSIQDFLALLGTLVGIEPNVLRVERSLLEANGFLPDCSPFSDVWMSELDNKRSLDELNFTYTPLRDYMGDIVRYYEDNPPPPPTSYRRRHAEKQFAATHEEI